MKAQTRLLIYKYSAQLIDKFDAMQTLFSSLMQLKGRLNVTNVIGLFGGIGAGFVEILYDQFDMERWPHLMNSDNFITNSIIDALIEHESYQQITLNSRGRIGHKINSVTIDGCCIGWCTYNYTDVENTLRFDGQLTRDEVINRISDIVWKHYATNALYIEKNEKKGVKFRAWNSCDMRSEIRTPLIEMLVARAKKFLDVGVTRSFALVGPPGTGKSVAAIHAASLLGGKCIKIPVGSLGCSPSEITQTLEFFKPDFIVIDDIDWSVASAELIHELESYRQLAKIVFVTYNKQESLPLPLLRPGRIDEIITVNEPDADVVRTIVGDEDVNFDVIKRWPIAFITEYNTLKTVLGQAEASKALVELSTRVGDNSDES